MQPKQNSTFKWVARMISFIWILLTACFSILNIFIFVQPQWIGDTLSSPRAGHFGLYSYCTSTITDYQFNCQGTWTNFETILNVPFAVATFSVGLSVLLILFCLAMFTLFLFLRPHLVYFICALIQMICSICLLIALVVYPSGFDDDTIRTVCGFNVNNFQLDTCQIRWAYILGIVAFFSASTLAAVGFFLGIKQSEYRTMREVINSNHVISKYDELNEATDDRTLSEQTMAIQGR